MKLILILVSLFCFENCMVSALRFRLRNGGPITVDHPDGVIEIGRPTKFTCAYMTSRSDSINAGPPLHQTHNSWQPSDSFLFSYPLPSLCSLRLSATGVVTLTGSGELVLVLAPPAWLWETPGPAPESLGPRTGFSVPVNTALPEEVVNHNELNFSPIFCNNRSILWSRMALQWIWGRVTMSAIIMRPPGCEIIIRRWDLCFASRKWDFSRTFSHSSWQ